MDVGTFPFTGTASSTSSPASDSAGGTLIITCPWTDVDGDGDVTVLDITAVAERWELPGNYSALYDLNCNGVIDIVDIQTAAALCRIVAAGLAQKLPNFSEKVELCRYCRTTKTRFLTGRTAHPSAPANPGFGQAISHC